MKEKIKQEEKDILEILSAFENEAEEKNVETKSEMEKVKYYERFSIRGIDFFNIFIATQRDENGNITQHIYSGSIKNEILAIDEEGNVDIKNDELKSYLSGLDLAETIKENEKAPGKLKGISEKAKTEEMKKALKDTNQDNEEQDSDTNEVETDLQEQGKDLGISSYKKIKDNNIADRMPGVFEGSEESGIAYSNNLNRFVIISKVNGKYQMNENIEPAKTTLRTIMSIDENGEQVEKKVPYALMRLPNNPNKEIAVTIGQYGIVDIETVDVLPCQERISRQVRMDEEGRENQETLAMREEFETQGEEYKHDIAHRVNQIEEAQKDSDQTVDDVITEKDYIPGIEPPITWGELMEETGESLPKLIQRYNKEMDANGKDSSKAVETIEDDYENVSHEHNQNRKR